MRETSPGLRTGDKYWSFSRRDLERSIAEGKNPVGEKAKIGAGIQSTTRHEKPCGKQGGPPPKAKYYLVTDSAWYREGKVKRTPGGE